MYRNIMQFCYYDSVIAEAYIGQNYYPVEIKEHAPNFNLISWINKEINEK